MINETKGFWIPGRMYQVAFTGSGEWLESRWGKNRAADEKDAPLYSLGGFHGGGGSLQHTNNVSPKFLKAHDHELPKTCVPLCFGDKFFLIKTQDFLHSDCYDDWNEFYLKILLRDKVLWIHDGSFYDSAKCFGFKRLGDNVNDYGT